MIADLLLKPLKWTMPLSNLNVIMMSSVIKIGCFGNLIVAAVNKSQNILLKIVTGIHAMFS